MWLLLYFAGVELCVFWFVVLNLILCWFVFLFLHLTDFVSMYVICYSYIHYINASWFQWWNQSWIVVGVFLGGGGVPGSYVFFLKCLESTVRNSAKAKKNKNCVGNSLMVSLLFFKRKQATYEAVSETQLQSVFGSICDGYLCTVGWWGCHTQGHGQAGEALMTCFLLSPR